MVLLGGRQIASSRDTTQGMRLSRVMYEEIAQWFMCHESLQALDIHVLMFLGDV